MNSSDFTTEEAMASCVLFLVAAIVGIGFGIVVVSLLDNGGGPEPCIARVLSVDIEEIQGGPSDWRLDLGATDEDLDKIWEECR